MYEREEIKGRAQMIMSPTPQYITGTYILSAQQKDLSKKNQPLVGFELRSPSTMRHLVVHY